MSDNTTSISGIVLPKWIPSKEPIESHWQPVAVQRYIQQPTVSEMLGNSLYDKFTLVIVDSTDGPTIFVHGYKGMKLDRDDLGFYRQLCDAVSGFESVNWDTDRSWVTLDDKELAAVLTNKLNK